MFVAESTVLAWRIGAYGTAASIDWIHKKVIVRIMGALVGEICFAQGTGTDKHDPGGRCGCAKYLSRSRIIGENKTGFMRV